MSTPALFAVLVPMDLPSVSNGSHGHWFDSAARTKKQRERVAWLWREAAHPIGLQELSRRLLESAPLTVRLVRLRPARARAYDAQDNLRRAFKAVVDEVAVELGLPILRYSKSGIPNADDADPRVTWAYADEKSDDGKPYVRIEVYRRESCPTCGHVIVGGYATTPENPGAKIGMEGGER